jgi:hypothetical protein
MPSITGELEDGWVLLRVKDNDSGAGTFADDPDYAGTNTAPAAAERINIPAQYSGGGGKTASLQVYLVAVSATDVAVDRGSFSVTLTATEVSRTVGNEATYGGSPEFVIDATPLAAVTLNRKVSIPLDKGQYALRLSTFANIPGTAAEIRVYAKVA